MRLRGTEEAYRKASPGFRNALVEIHQSLSASLPEKGLEVSTEVKTIWPNLMHPNITVPETLQADQRAQSFLLPSTQQGRHSTSASELLPGQSHTRSQCKPVTGGLLQGRRAHAAGRVFSAVRTVTTKPLVHSKLLWASHMSPVSRVPCSTALKRHT